MKLTHKMLRGLIKEAIQTREPGSPLWSPEKTKRTRKTIKTESLEQIEEFDIDSVIIDILNKAREHYLSLYDENDPVMSEFGRDSWHKQVQLAVDDLTNLIHDASRDVEDKLVNGDFYHLD